MWANPRSDDHVRAEAAINLGWSARNGDRPSPRAAKDWYRRAALLGHPSAFHDLGRLHVERGHFGQAARWFRLGAALDHPTSMYELARLHVERRVGAPDASLAAELLRVAARAVPRARRLLKSRKLARWRSSAPEPAVDRSADVRLAGTWRLRDSDAVFDIDIGRSTHVRCRDDEETLVVSHVAWRAGELSFVTLCRSTGWRIENRLLPIERRTLLVVRRGDSDEPTTALRR